MSTSFEIWAIVQPPLHESLIGECLGDITVSGKASMETQPRYEDTRYFGQLTASSRPFFNGRGLLVMEHLLHSKSFDVPANDSLDPFRSKT